jgi:hypothetical protein
LWRSRWRWTERCAAWDSHLDAEARQAEEEAARRNGEQLAERRRLQKERELDVGDRLLARAEQMLTLPLVETTIERQTADGAVIQRIEPAGWRLADAARFAEVGVRLKRLALDMESSPAPKVELELNIPELMRQHLVRQDPAPPVTFDDRRGS